jgi:hypothetical protein
MNVEMDIKIYIKDKLNVYELTRNVEQVDLCVEFIFDSLVAPSGAVDLVERVQGLSKGDLEALVVKFTEEEKFNDLINKSFELEARKALKEKIGLWDQEEFEEDELIEKAFLVKKRQELKKLLVTSEAVDKVEKEVSTLSEIWLNYKGFSIAASIIIALAVWQPQHWSDRRILDEYAVNINTNSLSGVSEFAKGNIDQNNSRGNDNLYFEGYTYSENIELTEAIALFENKNYELARDILVRLKVSKTDDAGLILYLAIAQLNSGEYSTAIDNLKKIQKSPTLEVSEHVDFYLGLAYLKAGERLRAKEIFRKIASEKENMFNDQASIIIKKLRWF